MLTIITNNVPRNLIYGYELTPKEREAFDYLDFSEHGDGLTHDFARYKGEVYDLSEFTVWDNPNSPLTGTGWDGMMSDTFFSGVLVKYVENFERVIMGRYYA